MHRCPQPDSDSTPTDRDAVRKVPTFVLAAAAGAALTMLCVAAPSLPKSTKVAEEILSTANISEVRLDISVLPNTLTGVGVTVDTVRQLSEEMLEEAGYTVGDDPAAPRLVVTMLTVESNELVDAVAVTTTIDVHQDVSVHRIDLDLNVPTMTIVVPDLLSSRKLQPGAEQLCRQAFNLLLQTFDLATDAMKTHLGSIDATPHG